MYIHQRFIMIKSHIFRGFWDNDIGIVNGVDDETEKIQQKKANHNCIYTEDYGGAYFGGDAHFNDMWSAIYIRKSER